MAADMTLAVFWWAILFLFGVVALPLTQQIFHSWWDRGYGLSKGMSLGLTTYIVWVLSRIGLLPFSSLSIIATFVFIFSFGIVLTVFQHNAKQKISSFKEKLSQMNTKHFIRTIVLHEVLFGAALVFWTWVKAHEPSIRSLEKFMDYGFAKIIGKTAFLPAPDMWYAGESINYYTFGHTMMAMITKFSGVHLGYTYNLMLATLFALTLTMSFTIGVQLTRSLLSTSRPHGKSRSITLWPVLGGALAGFLVTMGGNLQTVYVLTSGYKGEESPIPFWKIMLPLREWLGVLDGHAYWYANATRFIPFTIHEFPSYSFVVSDVHGHVLSLPFALFSIALMVNYFVVRKKTSVALSEAWHHIGLYGLFVGIMFMTNASDGLVYGALFVFLLVFFHMRTLVGGKYRTWSVRVAPGILAGMIGLIAMIPFLTYFKSFVDGIGVNCPPSFLANSKFGPLIFEGVEKCQHSPLWMVLLLWGFFFYNGVWLVSRIIKRRKPFGIGGALAERFLSVVFVFCVLLLIFPEFFYFRDIYPAHFRSNTMFKLGYQAFIMMSLMSAVVIVRMMTIERKKIATLIFLVFLAPQLFLVSMYPIYATQTYFGQLKTYQGVWGFQWQSREYPEDAAVIRWLDAQVPAYTRMADAPVIVEAVGESYTDYSRFSALAGVPTIVGWPVHEWLWRGTYDVVSPRIEEVRTIYTSADRAAVHAIWKKYDADYLIVGVLERQKYPELDESRFESWGSIVFEYGSTRVYRLFDQ